MKYRINPFAIVIQNGTSIQFLYAEKEGIISINVTKEQKRYIRMLLEGKELGIDELVSVFTQEITEKLIEANILVANETDTNSFYSRTHAFYGAFFHKDTIRKLEKASVLVLGCGGIGTHISWHLVTMGIKNLCILDYDVIDESNLNRQVLFSYSDIGKNKVDTLKERLLGINPQCKIHTINKRINSEYELSKIVLENGYDLIIKAVDTPADFPIWLDSVCQTHNIPYLTGIIMRDKAVIGPSYVPGISESGWEDLMQNVISPNSKKLYGMSPSVGLLLYHIADELAVEAFKILTGNGTLKLIDKIIVHDIFSNIEQVIESPNKSKERHIADKDIIHSRNVVAIINLLLFVCGFTISIRFISIISCMALSVMIPILAITSSRECVLFSFSNLLISGLAFFLRSFVTWFQYTNHTISTTLPVLLICFVAYSTYILIGMALVFGAKIKKSF